MQQRTARDILNAAKTCGVNLLPVDNEIVSALRSRGGDVGLQPRIPCKAETYRTI